MNILLKYLSLLLSSKHVYIYLYGDTKCSLLSRKYFVVVFDNIILWRYFPGTYCSCQLDHSGNNNCKLTCPTGFYGKNCQNPCKCQNGAKCDIVNGTILIIENLFFSIFITFFLNWLLTGIKQNYRNIIKLFSRQLLL